MALSLGTEMMQANFNHFYASTQEMVSGLVFGYETAINSWRQQTDDIVQHVVELSSSGNLEVHWLVIDW